MRHFIPSFVSYPLLLAPSETGLSPRIRGICVRTSKGDMGIASQGFAESFGAVPTQEEWDSSASTRSEWSVA